MSLGIITKASNEKPILSDKKPGLSKFALFAPLGLVIAYFLISAWIISPVGEFPLNDDWVYAQGVEHFLKSGQFFLPTTCSACFLQIIIGAAACKIVGFSYMALRFVSLAFGLFGGITFYLLLRELGAGRNMSSFLSMMYVSNPLLLQLCFTYMTDVPALGLTNAYMLFLIRGIKRNSVANILVASLFFCAAILVRQGVVLFAASNLLLVLLYAVKRNRSQKLLWTSIVGLIVIPAIVSIGSDHWLQVGDKVSEAYAWFRSIHTAFFKQLLHAPMKMSFAVLIKFGQIACYMSLFCAPALIPFLAFLRELFVKRSKVLAIWFVAAFGVIATSLTKLVAGDHVLMPVNQNMLRIPIIGAPNLLGISIPIFNERQRWWLTQASGLLAFLLLALIGGCVQYSCLLVSKARLSLTTSNEQTGEAPDRKFFRAAASIFVVSSCVVSLVVAAIETAIMDVDRHYLIALPSVILCLALAQRWFRLKPMWALSIALMVGFACYSTLANQDYLSWNRARYAAAQSLEAKGVPVRDIDGGAEYDFSHDVGLWIDTFKNYKFKRSMRDDWRWWRVHDDKYIISFSPVPMYSVVGKVTYWSGLAFGKKDVLILKRSAEADRMELPPLLTKNGKGLNLQADDQQEGKQLAAPDQRRP